MAPRPARTNAPPLTSNAPLKTFSKRTPLLPLDQLLPQRPITYPSKPSTTGFSSTSLADAEDGTPPWHRDFAHLEEDALLAPPPPSPAFAREFFKGTNADREVLTRHGKVGTFKLPGDWKLDEHTRFAAWTQLLGCECKWEGGLLWCRVTAAVEQQLRSLQAERDGIEFDELLPMPPPRSSIAPRMSMADEEWTREERRRLELALETYGPTNWPRVQADVKTKSVQECVRFYESLGLGDARHRLRKWQQAPSSVAALAQHEAEQLLRRLSSRRSSMGSRRSSVGGALPAGGARRSSVLPVMAPLSEEENEDKNGEMLDEKLLRKILDMLPPSALLGAVARVSRDWRRLAFAAANAHAATSAARSALGRAPQWLVNWDKMARAFPEGSFLADGAYKRVFKVVNRFTQASECVSVMDVRAIAKTGDPAVVAREVSTALALSELVDAGVCPNYVRTMQVFQADRDAPWAYKSGEAPKSGLFQYIRMELCDKGNLEDCMRQPLDIGVVPDVVFQLIYSVHAARQSALLRHWDIKCLNFFCQLRSKSTSGDVYRVRDGAYFAVSNKSLLVKLADLGTADTSRTTLGTRVGVQNFTTLENTPSELLLFGHAPQSFAADTFSMGLCVLHVLTGEAPYEEIMDRVRMPACLLPVVAREWEAPEFEALRQVIDDDEHDVLFHTLYRYAVLFGLSGHGKGKWAPEKSSVWQALSQALLGTNSSSSSTNQTKPSRAVALARKTFERDCAEFSLATGTHPAIERARSRAAQLGSSTLVARFCALDPSARPSHLEDVLCSDAMFRGLRIAEPKPEEREAVFAVDDASAMSGAVDTWGKW